MRPTIVPKSFPLIVHYQLDILPYRHLIVFLHQAFTHVHVGTIIEISILQEDQTLVYNYDIIWFKQKIYNSYLSDSLS